MRALNDGDDSALRAVAAVGHRLPQLVEQGTVGKLDARPSAKPQQLAAELAQELVARFDSR